MVGNGRLGIEEQADLWEEALCLASCSINNDNVRERKRLLLISWWLSKRNGCEK
jgi:hypothetical protein